MNLQQQFEFIIVAVPLVTGIIVILAALQLGKKHIYVPKVSPTDFITKNKTFLEKTELFIIEAGYGNILDAVKLYQIMITISVVVAISMFVRGSIIPGIFIGLAMGIIIPYAFLYYTRSQRQSKIELQLVDFLNEMGTRMQVSTSTVNAFVESIPNTQYPIRPILERIAKNSQQLNSFELAIEGSRTLISSPYYQDFVDTLQIHRETGGDVKVLILMAVEQINSKMITLKKFKAAMAAINLQLLLIFAAPPIAGWLTIMQNPESGEILFGSFIGWVILGVAIGTYAGGVGFSFWLKNKVKSQIS